MSKTYRTSEIAAEIGVHPNTVRFYESEGLLPPVPRERNGYRLFSEDHLCCLRLIRLAFRAEILSDNLREDAVAVLKTLAEGDRDRAFRLALLYKKHLGEEIERAQEAIDLTNQILDDYLPDAENRHTPGRREAAARVGVSMDVLRDWERNGLIDISRRGNRRIYGVREMKRLKIISVLRNAHYSQMAIRRMLQKLDQGEADLLFAIDTPEDTEDIVSVADRYITSLTGALRDVNEMLDLLNRI